jgi:head-tail adaptor
MNPGKLRHRVTIERQVKVQNPATGEIVSDYVAVEGMERLSAEVLPDRASEFFAGRQIQATQNAMIRMRWRNGVDATMRAKHHLSDGADPIVEYWDISGVVHFQDRFREMRLMCLQRDAEGFRRGVDLVNA